MSHKFPGAMALLRALDDGQSLTEASILSNIVQIISAQAAAKPLPPLPATDAAHQRAIQLIARRADLDFQCALRLAN